MIRTLRDEPRLQEARAFLSAAWRHLLRTEPTPIQYEVMDWMARGPRRLMVKGYRGLGKSWIASVYCTWLWAMDPDEKILVVSGGARRAADFTTFTRLLLDSWDVVRELRPEVNAIRDSKIQFDVRGASLAHAASMTSIGIGGQLVGARATTIIADDVETQANSDTPGKRERNERYVREFGSILTPGGRVRFLGTDHTEQSLYRTLREKGYSVRCWPAQYPSGDLAAAMGDSLAPAIRRAAEDDPALVGTATDPRRFPAEELLAKEAELGRSHYRLQFMLDPRLSDMDRFPLRLGDLVVMPLDPDNAPERVVYGGPMVDVPCLGFSGDRYLGPANVADRWLPYQGKVLAVDPAGRGKDETVAMVVGQLNGYLFLLEMRTWLNEGYADAVLASIAEMSARHRVSMVRPEDNFGDGMFTRLLEPHLHRSGHHAAVEPVRHNIQKERRIIDTLEPILQGHRLVVDPRVLRQDLAALPGVQDSAQITYRLAYQLSRVTRDRGCLLHDDRLDCLATAAEFWKDAMAQDSARRAREQDSRAMDAEIRRFMRLATDPLRGPSAPEPGWLGRATGRHGPGAVGPPGRTLGRR